MANVLGTLFQDIANAIRAKTGGTGTMKPAEFPAQISSIVAGDGIEWLVASGSIARSDVEANGIQTVEHGLGVVPDIIVVTANFVQSGVASHSPGSTYFGFTVSKRLMGDDLERYGESFVYNTTSGNGLNLGGGSIEDAEDNGLTAIYNVTSESFTCGNSNYPLLGVTFNWRAYAMK